MIPVFCRVKHEPEAGKYGDCVRACVASILELEPDAVPHFFHDGCSGEIGQDRLREYLTSIGRMPIWIGAMGGDPMGDFGAANPDVHYMLFGLDHVVVCRGTVKVHDPAWYAETLAPPADGDPWVILIIARAPL